MRVRGWKWRSDVDNGEILWRQADRSDTRTRPYRERGRECSAMRTDRFDERAKGKQRYTGLVGTAALTPLQLPSIHPSLLFHHSLCFPSLTVALDARNASSVHSTHLYLSFPIAFHPSLSRRTPHRCISQLHEARASRTVPITGEWIHLPACYCP